ncbi:UDP-N-acetylglucosamine 2-epimerase [Methanosarcina siciliae C2J]|uniref:UDP-N-acetylglucosamine 2-epimerase n=2 Tax=Methanosarcina siciliae TaxID=38027 RepID=A0A0E3P5S5_9EURY|nr:UDP-N-acetylglucosamine 2-epimerase [Methanosarcina siciliae T4/M]AKB36429.1 UDP-N-acetylglucosamine 2-epimerase [Methanosarcina siciliae C2J]
MRENTEWMETVEDGENALVGADYEKIMDAILNFEGAKVKGNVFGNGNACVNVLKVLMTIF